MAGAVPDAAALRRDARARGGVFERSVAAASDIESSPGVRRGRFRVGPVPRDANRRINKSDAGYRIRNTFEKLAGSRQNIQIFYTICRLRTHTTRSVAPIFQGRPKLKNARARAGVPRKKWLGPSSRRSVPRKLTLCSSGGGFRGASRCPPGVTLDDARASVDRGGGPRRGGTFDVRAPSRVRRPSRVDDGRRVRASRAAHPGRGERGGGARGVPPRLPPRPPGQGRERGRVHRGEPGVRGTQGRFERRRSRGLGGHSRWSVGTPARSLLHRASGVLLPVPRRPLALPSRGTRRPRPRLRRTSPRETRVDRSRGPRRSPPRPRRRDPTPARRKKMVGQHAPRVRVIIRPGLLRRQTTLPPAPKRTRSRPRLPRERRPRLGRPGRDRTKTMGRRGGARARTRSARARAPRGGAGRRLLRLAGKRRRRRRSTTRRGDGWERVEVVGTEGRSRGGCESSLLERAFGGRVRSRSRARARRGTRLGLRRRRGRRWRNTSGDARTRTVSAWVGTTEFSPRPGTGTGTGMEVVAGSSPGTGRGGG